MVILRSGCFPVAVLLAVDGASLTPASHPTFKAAMSASMAFQASGIVSLAKNQCSISVHTALGVRSSGVPGVTPIKLIPAQVCVQPVRILFDWYNQF